jgi:hypothetical protein
VFQLNVEVPRPPADDGQRQRQATSDKAANLQNSQATLDALQRELASRGVTVNLTVESGLRATVTTKRNDTKKASRSGTRAPFWRCDQTHPSSIAIPTSISHGEIDNGACVFTLATNSFKAVTVAPCVGMVRSSLSSNW